MAKKWSEVVSSDAYKKLPDAEKSAAQEQYFSQIVAPQVPETDVGIAREQFFNYAAGTAPKPSTPTTFQSKVEAPPAPKNVGSAADAYGAMGEGIDTGPVPVPTLLGSVAFDEKKMPVGAPKLAGTTPVKPEVLAAFEARYDAATPKQRKTMEAQPNWMGDIARSRAQESAARDVSIKKNPFLEKFDPRVEARRQELIGKGEKPEFAEGVAQRAAEAGIPAGQEMAYERSQGVLEPTKFDFEMFEQYRNAPAIVRGAVQGYEGFKQGALGVNQALAELVGADDIARTQALGAEESRGQVQSMGQNANYFGRMFEGAIGSIAQQLPSIVGGVLTGSQALTLGSMFVNTFGQEYSEGRSKGQDGAEAATRAGLFGSFEIIGERAGLKFAMDNIRRAASGMKTDQLGDFLANTLKKELPGEYLTTTGQFLTDKTAIGLNKDATLKDYLQQMADTTVQTLLQGGVMTGSTKALELGVNKLRGAEPVSEGAPIPSADQLMREEGFLKGKTTGVKEAPLETAAGEKTTTTTEAPAGRIEPTMAELTPEEKVAVRQKKVDDLAMQIVERQGLPAEDAVRIAEGKVRAQEEVETKRQDKMQGEVEKRDTLVAPAEDRVAELTDMLIGAGMPPTEAAQRATLIAQEEAENDQRAETETQGGTSAGKPITTASGAGTGVPSKGATGLPTGGASEADTAGLDAAGKPAGESTVRETVQPSSLTEGDPSVIETTETQQAKEEGSQAPTADTPRKRGRPALAPEQKLTAEQKRVQQRAAYKATDKQVNTAEQMLAESSAPVDEGAIESEAQLREMQDDKRRQRGAAIRTLYDISRVNKGKPGQRAAALLKDPSITPRELVEAEQGYELRKKAGALNISKSSKEAVEAAASEQVPDEELGKVTNGAQAITRIIKTGTEFQKTIARRLRNVVGGLKIVVVEEGQPLPEQLVKNPRIAAEWDRARALYIENEFSKDKILYVRGASFGADQGVNNITMLHELFHAATNRKIMLAEKARQNGDFSDKPLMRAYQDLIDTMLNAGDYYEKLRKNGTLPERMSRLSNVSDIFGDPREFVAYGMTDPIMQEFLKEADGAQSTVSFFKPFVDALRRLVGIGEDDTNALADLISATDAILTAREVGKPEPLEYVSRSAILNSLEEDKRTPIRFTDNVKSMYKKFKETGDTLTLLGQLEQLAGALEARASANESKRDKERVRGELYVRERLLKAQRLGEITPDGHALILWMLGKNPAIADSLAISFRGKGKPGVAGTYNPALRLVTLIKGTGSTKTGAHEFLHHTERMMPEKVRQGIRDEWIKQLYRLDRTATEAQNHPLMRAIDDAIGSALGNQESIDRLSEQIKDGSLPASFYQYVNPSEFWAVNGSRLVENRANAQGWVQEARQWIAEFIEKIKDIFGLDSQHAIIKGLNEVLNAEGTLTGAMIGQGGEFASVEPLDEIAKDEVRTQKEIDKEVAIDLEKIRISRQAEELARGVSALQALRDPRKILPALKRLWKGATYAQKSTLVNLVTTEFLASWGGSFIPELKNTNVLLEKMGGLTQQLLNSSAILAQTVHKAFKEDATLQNKLEEVAYASTLAEIDPSDLNADERSPTLDKLYAGLGLRGQQMFVLIKDHYENLSAYFGQLLDDQITNSRISPEAKNTLMAKIRKIYEADKKITPYFPLVRRGDFWLAFGSGKNRKFFTFETMAERDAAAEGFAKERRTPLAQLKEDADFTVGNDLGSMRKASFDSSDLLKGLFDIIDAENLGDPGAKDELKDAVYQLYLTTMPEQSFRRQFISRKNITGFSTDLLRNLSTTGVKMSTQLARVKYSPLLRNSISAARDSIAGREELEPFISEMEKRVGETLNPSKNGVGGVIASVLNRASFLHYLSGASSALLQPLGVFQTGMPILMARYGSVGTTVELSRMLKVWDQYGITRTNPDGTQSFVAPSIANATGFSPEEKKAVREMLARDVSQSTYASALFEYKSAATINYGSIAERGKRAAATLTGGLIHSTERLSREMLFMAAYRLNRKAGKTYQQAVDNAVNDTNEALGNYGAYNRPPIMKKGLGKVMLQFTMYPLHVTLFLLRNFKKSLPLINKEGKWEATKIFYGTLGTSYVLAGAVGLPMFSMVMGLLGWAWRDEDKPQELKDMDYETWWRTVWLPENLGQVTIGGRPLSAIVERGPVNGLTGLDISSRTGLNDLWLRDVKETKTARESMVALALEKAGPSANMILSYADAYEAMINGDYQKAVEKISPALVRNFVMTHKYATEGAKDNKGTEIMAQGTFTSGELLGQAIGFRSDLLANTQRVAFKMAAIDQRINNERTKMLNNIAREYVVGENTNKWDGYLKQLEKREKFNTRYPEKAITEDQLVDSLEKRQKQRGESFVGVTVDEKSIPYTGETMLNIVDEIERREREMGKRK